MIVQTLFRAPRNVLVGSLLRIQQGLEFGRFILLRVFLRKFLLVNLFKFLKVSLRILWGEYEIWNIIFLIFFYFVHLFQAIVRDCILKLVLINHEFLLDQDVVSHFHLIFQENDDPIAVFDNIYIPGFQPL